jgi:hypothetical protein
MDQGRSAWMLVDVQSRRGGTGVCAARVWIDLGCQSISRTCDWAYALPLVRPCVRDESHAQLAEVSASGGLHPEPGGTATHATMGRGTHTHRTRGTNRPMRDAGASVRAEVRNTGRGRRCWLAGWLVGCTTRRADARAGRGRAVPQPDFTKRRSGRIVQPRSTRWV